MRKNAEEKDDIDSTNEVFTLECGDPSVGSRMGVVILKIIKMS